MKQVSELLRSIPASAAVLAVVTTTFLVPSANAEYMQPAKFNKLPEKSISPGGNTTTKVKNLVNKNKKGVIVTFKKGEYTVNETIALKKNVHIRFEAGVKINQGSSDIVFDIQNAVNTSIVGPATIIGIKPSGDTLRKKFKAVRIAKCSNFLVKNLVIKANLTKLSLMSTGTGAKNGRIENITATGSAPGYGLYQIQAGENIVCHDLDGTGGYTLRIEQGGVSGLIKNLTATKITCRNGRGAVLAAPNQKGNGAVTIGNVKAIGCQWAAAFGGKGDGTFSSLEISAVTAEYGTQSQFRKRTSGIGEYKTLLPDNLQRLVSGLPNSQGGQNGKFATGPAFGVIFLRDNEVNYLSVSGKIRRQNFPKVYNSDPTTIKLSKVASIAKSR